MSDSILGAVVQMVKGASFYGEMTGGFWALNIPDGQAYPSGYVAFSGTGFTWEFGSSYIERPRVEIVMYATSAELCESLARRTWKWLLDREISITDTSSIQLYPTDFRGREVARRDQDAKRVFEFIVPMEAWFGGTAPSQG